MAGNPERDLAKDMRDEVESLEESKYYENVNLELEKIALENTLIEEKHRKENKDGVEKETLEYNVYIKFKGEDIKIATISEDGKLIPNKALLEDEKFSDEDKAALGNMLNTLGLEQGKVDINKLQEKLKEIEAKTKEELENDKEKEKDETAKNELDGEGKEEEKDNNNEKDKEEEEPKKDIRQLEAEAEQKRIAERKGIDDKNICKIRRDSQFYINYPNIPKTAYFYLDKNDRMHAEYIDKDGSIKELEGFTETQDRDPVVSLGHDGENVKRDIPYRVMTAKGLEDSNKNTQEVRIAISKDSYGYLTLETIHQGRNGEWEGKNIDTYGREENTGKMNKLIDERTKTPNTGVIAQRQSELRNSGFSENGLTLDEMSKKRKIDEYMKDGYTEEEANKIYSYVVGELELNENDAKTKVNIEHNEKEEEEGRTPWGDAEDRRNNRR